MGARRGFTLLEVLVVLALLVGLAAVIIPQVAGRVRQGTTAALASSLTDLQDAVAAFRGDVRRYPASLLHLTTPPAGGETDACGGIIPAALLQGWNGPYLQRSVSPAGVPAGDALILPGLARTAGVVGELSLRAVYVDGDLAMDLDAAFDGDGDLATGAIRWSAAGDDTLRYVVPVRGC